MSHPEIVSAFIKSSASSGPTNDCVEVARTADGGRAVRDSKDPGRGTQFHPPTQWAAFLGSVKAGAFGN